MKASLFNFIISLFFVVSPAFAMMGDVESSKQNYYKDLQWIFDDAYQIKLIYPINLKTPYPVSGNCH